MSVSGGESTSWALVDDDEAASMDGSAESCSDSYGASDQEACSNERCSSALECLDLATVDGATRAMKSSSSTRSLAMITSDMFSDNHSNVLSSDNETEKIEETQATVDDESTKTERRDSEDSEDSDDAKDPSTSLDDESDAIECESASKLALQSPVDDESTKTERRDLEDSDDAKDPGTSLDDESDAIECESASKLAPQSQPQPSSIDPVDSTSPSFPAHADRESSSTADATSEPQDFKQSNDRKRRKYDYKPQCRFLCRVLIGTLIGVILVNTSFGSSFIRKARRIYRKHHKAPTRDFAPDFRDTYSFICRQGPSSKQCRIEGDQSGTLRFGVPGQWTFKKIPPTKKSKVPVWFNCAPDAFGSSLRSKGACYFLPDQQDPFYEICKERSECRVEQPGLLRYGLKNKWRYKQAKPGEIFKCGNPYFGEDPLVGVRKTCFFLPDALLSDSKSESSSNKSSKSLNLKERVLEIKEELDHLKINSSRRIKDLEDAVEKLRVNGNHGTRWKNKKGKCRKGSF